MFEPTHQSAKCFWVVLFAIVSAAHHAVAETCAVGDDVSPLVCENYASAKSQTCESSSTNLRDFFRDECPCLCCGKTSCGLTATLPTPVPTPVPTPAPTPAPAPSPTNVVFFLPLDCSNFESASVEDDTVQAVVAIGIPETDIISVSASCGSVVVNATLRTQEAAAKTSAAITAGEIAVGGATALPCPGPGKVSLPGECLEITATN